MKQLSFFLLLALLFGCSKEKIEEIQTDIVVQAMTNGQWKVTSYVKASQNMTADFNGYSFQFKTDKSVDAIQNGNVSSTGSWSANADAKTITSNFPAQAAPTLLLLNGTWKITKNSFTYVEAEQTVSGQLHTLRLEKI